MYLALWQKILEVIMKIIEAIIKAFGGQKSLDKTDL